MADLRSNAAKRRQQRLNKQNKPQRATPRSIEAAAQQRDAQRAQSLTNQNNTARISGANKDLAKLQQEFQQAVPGSSRANALQRQIQGKQNQIGILQSGAPGAPRTAGGQRALSELAGQAATFDPNFQSPQAGAGGRAGALGFNPQGTQDTGQNIRPRSRAEFQSDFFQEPDFSTGSFAQLSTADQQAVRTGRLQQAAAQEQIQNLQQQRAQQQLAQRGVQSGAVQRAQDAGTSAAIESIIGALPPGNEFLGNALRNSFNQQQAALGDIQSTTGQQIGLAEDSFRQSIGMLSDGQRRATDLFEASRGFLKDNRDRNRSLIQEQQALADQQLQWQEAKQVRDARKGLNDEVDRRYSALALAGGFGSSNGIGAIEDARREGEQAISDYQAEIGFQRQEVALKYTGLIAQAEDQYTTSMLQEMNNLEARLNQIDQQALSTVGARNQAISNALSDSLTRTTNLRQDLADNVLNAAVVVKNELDAERQAKFKAEVAEADFQRKMKMDELKFLRDLQRDEIGFQRDLSLEEAKRARELQDELRVSPEDSLKEQNKLTDLVLKSQTYKSFNEIERQFGQMQRAFEQLERGEIGPGVADEAIILTFEKILDPGSVVREGEFARVASGLGFSRATKAAFQKALKGGQGIDNLGRESVIKLAEQLRDAAKENFVAENAFVVQRLQNFNNQDFLDRAIDYRALPGFEYLDLPNQDVEFIDGFFSDDPSSFDTGNTENLPPVGAEVATPVVNGRITGYGSDASAFGLDIAAPRGTEVRAHVPGKVVGVVFNENWEGSPASSIEDRENINRGKKQNGGFGNQVRIRFDNGMTGLFSHLDGVRVKKGDTVSPGNLLGSVGNTGITIGKNGYHLDFELRDKTGKRLSPEQAASFLGIGSPIA